MEIRDINEIKAAIKYMDYKPVLLAKFYDIKSLLFKEMVEHEDYYKVSSILPNPLNDDKIIKCINILDRKYMAGKEVVDCTKGTQGLPAGAAEILKSVVIREAAQAVKLSFQMELDADVYLKIPRGNHISMKKLHLNGDTEFEVMNPFNTYVSEGFTLALHMENMAVSIEPSALDGIKGQGDVFVYVMTENFVYKDMADKYFDTTEILKVYRG